MPMIFEYPLLDIDTKSSAATRHKNECSVEMYERDIECAIEQPCSPTTLSHVMPSPEGRLWRVKCQRGCEDQVVVGLTKANALKDTLISVFAISAARTWVYIRIQLSGLSIVKAFLASLTAVIQSHNSPVLEEVPFEEHARTVKMRNDKVLQVHDWVVVTEGIYEGALGCLVASHECGWNVLVIPRTFPHERQGARPHGKAVIPNSPTPGCSSKLDVDQGLLLLECDHQSVLPATAAPLEVLALFQQSEHPTVIAAQAQAPCPAEWCFEVGELVAVSDAMHPCVGHIFQINNNDLDITLDDASGVRRFPYIVVDKIFAVGDFVRWVDTGREGVIQHTNQFHVTALQLYEDGHHEEFECAKNSVIKALPPKLLDPLLYTISAPIVQYPSLPLPPSQSHDSSGHWTSDPRLVGREFRIRIGGKAKVVMLQKGANDDVAQAYVRRGKRKLELMADRKLIEAMHPANPRNYERWIVIEGEHTGKYVRSIRYNRVKESKESIQWTVATVEPIIGECDKLTGENLDLDSSCLCLEAENDTSKWRNMKFSRNLREEARR